MMLHTVRPSQWSHVVGQQQPIRVLHAALRHQKEMPVGFIFNGSHGVGKNSTAYLFARALLCSGKDPLGCGSCPSCQAMAHPDSHPDYTESVAAQVSGVAQARELLLAVSQPSVLGPRRVVVLDEVHRLSPEAWDVYLSPLERRSPDVVFLFLSNHAAQIPDTIGSRCVEVTFSPLVHSDMVGVLTARAAELPVRVHSEGIKAIAKLAKGHARDALKMLSLVALTGDVTRENCALVLRNDITDQCKDLFTGLIRKDMAGTSDKALALAEKVGTRQVIETMFSVYSEFSFRKDSGIASAFPRKATSAIFLQWLTPHHLPADTIALFLLDLDEVRRKDVVETVAKPPAVQKSAEKFAPVVEKPSLMEKEETLNADEFFRKLGIA